jgi:hypothetical protein
MKIFISWSGDKSKAVAAELRKWIPAVLQFVDLYFTPDDVEKGMRWANDISQELETSDIGILCLTPENLHSDWLIFEAGAISKNVGTSRVCPILFDVNPIDITGPLTQFQHTIFNKKDIRKLLYAINNLSNDRKLSEAIFDSVFEKWWPDLESSIKNVYVTDDRRIKNKMRTDSDVIEEILNLVRYISKQKIISRLNKYPLLEEYILGFIGEFDKFFGSNWNETKEFFSDGKIEIFVGEDETFIESAKHRGNSKKWLGKDNLLLYYSNLKEFLEVNEINEKYLRDKLNDYLLYDLGNKV